MENYTIAVNMVQEFENKLKTSWILHKEGEMTETFKTEFYS
jgi:hypothetical protein